MFKTSHENRILSGNTAVDSVYHNAEWLVTAFAGTLVFIIFVMQVYRIPTGSMAETLRGAHFRVRCAQCGYRYDHDFIAESYGMLNTANPAQKLPILHKVPTPSNGSETFVSSRCPSCGYSEPPAFLNDAKQLYTLRNNRPRPVYLRTVFKGDQIFVLKSIYQFFEPKRWDVIVFKNPTQPPINYIKRCIALPGETLQIIDGDIFIDGHIQRKPEKVQEELWMLVYDNDFQPARPQEVRFNGHTWKQPFENVGDSKWNLTLQGQTVFELDSANDEVHRIQYNTKQGNDFKATYAYDNPVTYHMMPICSDLMVQYHLTMQQDAAAGAEIRKNGICYQGWINANGRMEISQLSPDGQPVSLTESRLQVGDFDQPSRFRFAVVDQQLVLEYRTSRLVHDLGNGLDAAGTNRKVKPRVRILGAGKLQLEHTGVYRDIYYLSSDESNGVLRASRDNPMTLGDEEYFACGDNSPYSADSRMWDKEGLANNGKSYTAGVVPKDYLVGKAMFVHWPGGYRLKQEPIRWIPFPDGMKAIFGGEK